MLLQVSVLKLLDASIESVKYLNLLFNNFLLLRLSQLLSSDQFISGLQGRPQALLVVYLRNFVAFIAASS